MTNVELLALLVAERQRPTPEPALPTDERWRALRSQERLEAFMRRWDIK